MTTPNRPLAIVTGASSGIGCHLAEPAGVLAEQQPQDGRSGFGEMIPEKE